MTDPWETHFTYMAENYGQRDPDCAWCGRPVWMALQGFVGGAGWTADAADEGPCSRLSPEGLRCEESPDGEHDVLPVRETAS
jgi:hypothetical protein